VRVSFDWKKYAGNNNISESDSLIKWMKEKNLSLKRKFRLRINRLNKDFITFFRLINWEYNDKSEVS
jgi:hypothetical protein